MRWTPCHLFPPCASPVCQHDSEAPVVWRRQWHGNFAKIDSDSACASGSVGSLIQHDQRDLGGGGFAVLGAVLHGKRG